MLNKENYFDEKYKDKLSFERFNKLVKHRLNGRQLIHTSLEDYIDETLRFEKENIINNELTDQFKDDLIYNLNNKTSWEYIDLGSLYSMTTYRLNIPEPYETKVQNFLLDYFNCISCS